MTFLQPALLAALPLVALPLIIHLINQRRYQTVRWGAMMFLLAANRMARGYARLRQWLIMAVRMAAIAALVFVISRPLAGGWLGLSAGGRPDTTLVLLDRSPSMRQGGPSGSKLETGRRQLAGALQALGSLRWVLIEGGANRPREMESPGALLDAPAAGPADAPSDVPGMLAAARDYVRANKPGRTEVWICSDLRENDWDPDGGRWSAVRDAFRDFPQGVRFHLLAYPEPAPGNLAVRVTEARSRKAGDGSELVVSLRLTREGGGDARGVVPVRFEIDGARSEVAVEMAGPRHELREHRIALAPGHERGWGRVSIPADANPADDDFWFVYDRPAPRKTVVVADGPDAAEPLRLAASVSPEPGVEASAEVAEPGRLAAVDWDDVSLLLWQAPLPESEEAAAVRSFAVRGGRVVFFPPRSPGAGELFGVSWTGWTEGPETSAETWRGDQDLLANTQSGAALPVGRTKVRRWCGMAGEVTPLAALRGGAPLLARAATNAGGVYFCATTPAAGDSSLAADGVALYVLVQRALSAGAESLGATRQVAAGGAPGGDAGRWERVAGAEGAVSTEYRLHAGVYRDGERLLAVNRPEAEDQARVVAGGRVAGLFRGLDFARVDDRAGSLGSLIREVWRVFLVAMLAAMVGEAALCLPRPRPAGAAS